MHTLIVRSIQVKNFINLLGILNERIIKMTAFLLIGVISVLISIALVTIL